MHDELDALAERARALEALAPEKPAAPAGAPVVLYGGGPLGRLTLANLRHVGIEPVAFVDSNAQRWHQAIEGIPVLPPAEAARRHGDSARFVVTIYNGSAVRAQLRALGVRHVAHFAEVYLEHPAELLPFCAIAPRSVVLDAWPQVRRAADVWCNERSRHEYASQLAWRLRLGDVPLPAPDHPSECYFPQDVYSYLDDEVLVDCGAFDGDSLRQYFARSPASGSRTIVALEPDDASRARLSAYVAGLDPRTAGRVLVEPFAVAEASGEVRFRALGSVCSGVADDGDLKVPAIAIDDIDVAPTLIKMDVEGFELKALEGARRRLKSAPPVLAISLYHHASDLWTIPNFLKSLVPDYNLHLRRYAEDCWELVLYAVPPSRTLLS